MINTQNHQQQARLQQLQTINAEKVAIIAKYNENIVQHFF